MSKIPDLLPCAQPVQLIAPDGAAVEPSDEASARGYAMPPDDDLLAVWRAMVIGRRFDAQATALTKQGRLAVYPSSRGQDACQVAPVLELKDSDWFFPTYRDSMALVARGIDPVKVLTLLRGDWHCGYDSAATRTAPQCTPLATQAVHAAGAADGLRRRGTDGVALCFVGDGATSEGDFHEAVNFAGVFNAPVVFLVQNNGYAISVPLAKQTKAPALSYKGIGYGVRAEQVDGNDAAAVLAVTRAAYQHARSGKGPFLIEAHTYRMEAHTNADDATRYRTTEEVDGWTGQDPIVRLQAYLVARGALDDARIEEVRAQGESLAADLRARMNAEPVVDPMELFAHVYAEPTPQLREQAQMVQRELAGSASAAGAHLPTPTKEEAR
ncbi:MAG: thiamine pyrophosphate-dependent dehydrogenase E1 component subunit alpha [Ornithinimicrobium sp.]|uniref:thiamine pyrophosphate-dependent dehydrogenase E1 component subunit alpha n=1 Tax=Ornithinimicrobium sp. TaxID=1977084 RepID=UPI0026DFA769|nr:thiamine pyrophosphate-dependent dehydrogenase E1 component subunit alpha [Ornithinimicrobium sp.]MDO5741025.1 thiamine pyrophosphate-dependent dehydrogenase E1 component subunit alpha [Ornithinimicrobium sp.]